MISYMDITSFMSWFTIEAWRIMTDTYNKLKEIQIANGVNLLTFIWSIVIATIFIQIIMNSASSTGNKIVNKVERKKK